jgi:8-oxo-dGTP pyrophosphatase MutT (NUDIX family)
MSKDRELPKRYCLGFAHDGDQVVLCMKAGAGPDGRGLNGIGGKVEAHEGGMDAMEREWTEETGLASPMWSFCGEMAGHGFIIYVYGARYDTMPEPSAMRGGDQDVRLVPMGEVFDVRANATGWLRPLLAMAVFEQVDEGREPRLAFPR